MAFARRFLLLKQDWRGRESSRRQSTGWRLYTIEHALRGAGFGRRAGWQVWGLRRLDDETANGSREEARRREQLARINAGGWDCDSLVEWRGACARGDASSRCGKFNCAKENQEEELEIGQMRRPPQLR
jgi:hypothetical protein